MLRLGLGCASLAGLSQSLRDMAGRRQLPPWTLAERARQLAGPRRGREEICDRAATPRVDVSDLHGSVTGYLVSDVESARQSLQPLMLAHAFDSFGRDGVLAFSSRHGRMGVVLSPEELVAMEGKVTLELTRAAALEATGRVILSYVRGDADYQTGAAESVATDMVESDASRSSVTLTLSDDEARGVADRWLSEARVALSTAQFQLPLSMLGVTAGT